MYENREENDGIFFEIPTHLFCERGNSAKNRAGKFMMYLNFPTLDILICIAIKDLRNFSVVLYPIFIHNLLITLNWV